MTEDVIIEIKNLLVEKTPHLPPEKKSMMYKIINPDISNYVKYGVKVAEIENIVKNVYSKFMCNNANYSGKFHELFCYYKAITNITMKNVINTLHNNKQSKASCSLKYSFLSKLISLPQFGQCEGIFPQKY